MKPTVFSMAVTLRIQIFRSITSKDSNIVRPIRYLNLLKHVKLSVISREESTGQEGWVANFLNGLRRDDMRLDTFEMTWFGWKRFCLRNGGMVSQTLQTLHVEKHIIIKVTGEAIMVKGMLLELEQKSNTTVVVIQRTVTQTTKGEYEPTVILSSDSFHQKQKVLSMMG